MGFVKFTGAEKVEVLAAEKLSKLTAFLRRTGKTASELSEEEKQSLHAELND